MTDLWAAYRTWVLASLVGAVVFFAIDATYFIAYALPAWLDVQSEFSNWVFFDASTLWWPRVVALAVFVVAATLGRRVGPAAAIRT